MADVKNRPVCGIIKGCADISRRRGLSSSCIVTAEVSGRTHTQKSRCRITGPLVFFLKKARLIFHHLVVSGKPVSLDYMNPRARWLQARWDNHNPCLHVLHEIDEKPIFWLLIFATEKKHAVINNLFLRITREIPLWQMLLYIRPGAETARP